MLGTNRGTFGILHSWVLSKIPWDAFLTRNLSSRKGLFPLRS